MEMPVRYLIEGELLLTTPLHLGSGESTLRKGLLVETPEGMVRAAEVSGIMTDGAGCAYIPGRALKGALRSWLTAVGFEGSDLLAQVLGSEEIVPKEERQGKPAFGGKAELWNAFLLGHGPGVESLPFWCGDRGTAVRASIALDRRTKTVAGGRLFHEEFVPPGARFRARISAQGLADDELDLLLFALEGFNHPDRPLSLGAGAADGHGRCTWRRTGLSRLLPGEIRLWLEQEPAPAGYERLFPIPAEEMTKIEARAASRWTVPAASELAVQLAITFDAPFLVAAPHRKGEEEGPDHLPLSDAAGRPLLPASSLRGALRQRAEKILRTLGVRACRPEAPEEACKPVLKTRDVGRLCAACRLFGAPGWGSLLSVPDFTAGAGIAAPDKVVFEHVAIDRFSGGVSGSLKFSTEAFVGAKLEGRLRLDLSRRAEPWMEGLLALVLRDLVQGDLPLGFGSAKGYGSCRAEVTEIKGRGVAWRRGEAVGTALGDELSATVQSLHVWAKASGDRQPAPASVATAVPLPPAIAPSATAPKKEEGEQDAFHNPYHFVPLGPAMADPEKISTQEFAAGRLGVLAHDRFHTGENFFSGRLLFRVTTESPTVVGGERVKAHGSEPALVKPFELGNEPALPGASLRGLLSSLAEAATGSALRVLDDRSLSYRAQMRDSLPALGRLVLDAHGELQLEPMALPPLPCNAARSVFPRAVASWKQFFPQPMLRVYVNGYWGRKNEGVSLQPGSFLERVAPRSASSDNPNEIWYYPIGALPAWTRDGKISMPNPHVKKTGRPGKETYQVVAQDRDPVLPLPPGRRAEPISQLEFDALDQRFRSQYVPGVLRILDIAGHEKEIPDQRIHEIFLPLPDKSLKWPRLDSTDALKVFHRLAAERTQVEAHLPFGLKGKEREPENEKIRLLRLKAGDIVFFQVDPDDPGRVAEIALSSIWRRGAGTLFRYIDQELLPFHPGRKQLSPAERLFGFVEQDLKGKGKKEPALAIASRIRFAFGRLEPGTQEPWYLQQEPMALAILGSPKPPAPALYFRDQEGSDVFIPKSGLDPDRHTVQGRKVYLHHPPGENGWLYRGEPDDRPHLRSKVKPLRPKLGFLAHLDFDNLTERELALLLYALRPTPAFRHLLGMGKPLGLGRVEISPLGLFLVDRQQRYGEEFDLLASPRYHRATLAAPLPEVLPRRYAEEADAVIHAAAGLDLADLVDRFRAAMPTEIRFALELLGDPASVSAPVSYPRTPKKSGDVEGFEWFKANEDSKNHGQQLLPIVPSAGLPTLRPRHGPAGQAQNKD
jgi:CRISPR/Cas system CSM-associated protein Csm3 (group 7 of RAMP superfamily)